MDSLPSLFCDRFQKIIPPEHLESTLKSFSRKKVLSARVNTLKTRVDEAHSYLKSLGIAFETIPWFQEALKFKNVALKELEEIGLLKKGLIYIQSLSSMIPA